MNCDRRYECPMCDYPDGRGNHYQHCDVDLDAPWEPSLCWDVKVGWVPVRAIDPATGRCYVDGSAPTYEAPE